MIPIVNHIILLISLRIVLIYFSSVMKYHAANIDDGPAAVLRTSRPINCCHQGKIGNLMKSLEPDPQIQAYVFDVIRASVPKLNLDDAFEQKNEIAKAVEEELEKAMSAYGYEIVQTLIIDIEPDEHVKRAMNEINAAARLRVAATEKAEAEKILQIKRAEGEAESKYLSGLGIARQRQAIVDGLRDSVLGFSVNVPGTTAKDVMDMVLVTQYFDTMKEIGATSKSSAVFIPPRPWLFVMLHLQIRDGLLQGSVAH
ncbi:hypothetical protein J5N97_013373 [Dioscorea zingiberensis]|uniref:Band 7 domain-containing protein n=1 Tax=Dioscorea zingiberensis TaxID=325984 RepID=A0A9D5HIQ2_9LILI|nr:hypothetical protein J5N97_013373 [Dioscorea zingiberensis]